MASQKSMERVREIFHGAEKYIDPNILESLVIRVQSALDEAQASHAPSDEEIGSEMDTAWCKYEKPEVSTLDMFHNGLQSRSRAFLKVRDENK